MPLYVQQEKMGHAGSCHQLLSASLLCAQLLVRVVLDVLLCFTDNLRCLHTAFIVLSAWTAGRTHPISHPFNAVSLKTAPTPGSTDVMTTCFQDLWWIESSWLARLKKERGRCILSSIQVQPATLGSGTQSSPSFTKSTFFVSGLSSQC